MAQKAAKKFVIFFVIAGLISGIVLLDLFGVQHAQAAVPTIVNVGAVANGTGTITPGMPTSVQTNDILLLFIETADQTITVSEGTETWTQITGSPVTGATGTRLTAFWARASQNSPTSPTTSDSGNHQLARMIAFRGVIEAGDPWDVVSASIENTSDASVSFPSVTTTVADTFIVNALAGAGPDGNSTGNFSGWTNENLGSITERIDNRVNSGNGGLLGAATGIKTVAGSTGATTATLANATVEAMITIALKPNQPPTLSIVQPDGAGDAVTEGDAYAVTYSLADTDNVVTAAFSYDTDNSGLDGMAISDGCSTAAEGTGATCSWNTTGVTPGSYYVYGITSDGVNPQVSAYSSGTLTVNAVPVISVSTVVPNAGAVGGGTDVTISGANFQSGATITFDGLAATNIVFVDTGTLTAKTPAHAAGMVDVTVTNPDLTSDTLVNGFTYTSAAVVYITASPLAVFTGESSVVNWSTENADSCQASGAWSGAKATSGDETVTPSASGTYTYALECSGAGGSGSGSVSVLVTPPGAHKEPGVLFRFDGFAYPDGKIFLYDNNVPFSQLVSDLSGRFATSFRLIDIAEKHLFSIIAYDKEGNVSPSKTFPSELYAKEGLIDILIAPTIALHKRALGNKESLRISGYATPGNKVQVEIDGKVVGTVPTTASGYYTLSAPLSSLALGDHTVRSMQVAASSRTSDYSLLKAFQIAEPFAANVDLNNDGKLTISDWSIFLSSWSSREAVIKKKIDFNDDGKITIFDLSVFLSSFRKK